MKVREAVQRLQQMDQNATLFTSRDGFSVEVDMIEPAVGVYQTMCEVAHACWQRCLVEDDVCNRKQIKGVLLI